MEELMASTKFDLTFPHQYEVEESQELPSRPSTMKHLYFPGGSDKGGQDGLLIKITPHVGEPWLGTFAFGSFQNGVTGVYSCPDEESVCVISAGEGYIVRADDPVVWKEIGTCPILNVRIVASKELLLFADFTRITAYGRRGHVWTTGSLSWDGIEIVNLTPEYIQGLAWDSPQQRKVEFVVDVETGRHTGGSSSEDYANAQ
jgi:hypothetical protein